MIPICKNEKRESKKNLHIRNNSVTPLLTESTVQRNNELIFKNRESVFERVLLTQNNLNQKPLLFSFGKIESNVLDFVNNEKLFEDFKILAQLYQRKKTFCLIEKFFQEHCNYAIERPSLKQKSKKIKFKKMNTELQNRIHFVYEKHEAELSEVEKSDKKRRHKIAKWSSDRYYHDRDKLQMK